MKIVAAEVHIPNESRKIEKLRIFSKVSAKNKTMMHIAEKTVNEVTNTSFFSLFVLRKEGSTPSSLIANITRGLHSNEPFTYASTERNRSNENALAPFAPNIFPITTEAISPVVFILLKPTTLKYAILTVKY